MPIVASKNDVTFVILSSPLQNNNLKKHIKCPVLKEIKTPSHTIVKQYLYSGSVPCKKLDFLAVYVIKWHFTRHPLTIMVHM